MGLGVWGLIWVWVVWFPAGVLYTKSSLKLVEGVARLQSNPKFFTIKCIRPTPNPLSCRKPQALSLKPLEKRAPDREP